MQIKSALPGFQFTGNYRSINCPVSVYQSVFARLQPDSLFLLQWSSVNGVLWISKTYVFLKCTTPKAIPCLIIRSHLSEAYFYYFLTDFNNPFLPLMSYVKWGVYFKFCFFLICQSHFHSMRLIWGFSLSHREAGMRLRRSIICCSSVLLCAVSASSASAWSIAGLLWTVVELCSSVGCFHTPSIIRFSTTDPLFCTKTILSRYEEKLDCPESFGFTPFKWHLLSAFLHIILVFLYTCSAEIINIPVILVEASGLFLLYGSLQMQRAAEGSDRNGSALRYVLLTSGRIILWWCLAECLIHAMYMHSIQSNETYLEMLPPWALGESQVVWIFAENYSIMLCLTHKISINVVITALLFDLSVILYLLLSYFTNDWKSFPLPASGGLALALVQFFYVKYLVLFGLPSMLATLDGVLPPKLPRCVSIMHSFTEMWR